MPRDLTYDMKEALASPNRWPVRLIDIDWPGAPIRVWTGTGPLLWNGQTYHGVGLVGRIEGGGRSDSEMQIREVRLVLSGVPSRLAQLALDQPIRGRRATIWLAMLRPDGTVIPSPRRIDVIDLDYPTIQIDNEASSSIVLVGVAGWYTLRAPVTRAWTTETQQITYPTDVGLDAIPTLQNRDDAWTFS